MIFNDLHEKAQCTLDQLDPAVLDVSHRSDEALHPGQVSARHKLERASPDLSGHRKWQLTHRSRKP